MSSAPEIETSAAQPYVAIRAKVTMGEIEASHPLRRGVGWLDGYARPRGTAVLQVQRHRHGPRARDGRARSRRRRRDDQVGRGSRPGGMPRSPHMGTLGVAAAATKALLDAAEQDLAWDVTPGEDGDRWACRLESYLTDPDQEPDMSKWVTQLAFKLAG